MKVGKLKEQYIQSTIFPNAPILGQGEVFGLELGIDFTQMDDLITADGAGNAPYEAWNKALNHFLCSMQKPIGVRIHMVLSEHTKESTIKLYMEAFHDLANRDGVQILGGHSQVYARLEQNHFYVTMIGTGKGFLWEPKQVAVGDSILMVGYAGTMGNNIMIDRYGKELENHFQPVFLRNARVNDEDFSVFKVVNALREVGSEAGITYIHANTHGGIYQGLWRMGKWAKKGFAIDNSKIPIRQETIEICEHFQVNPYLLDATGTMVILCKKGSPCLKILEKQGFTVAKIGEITKDKDRVVCFAKDEYRTLAEEPYDALDLCEMQK